MRRFFNTTGPCDPRRHYILPPERRIPQARTLIERQLYFLLHAPRQSGKTTAIRALAKVLRDEGVAALYVTVETARLLEDTGEAEPLWLNAIGEQARQDLPESLRPPPDAGNGAPKGERLKGLLGAWSAAVAPTPVVVFFDEVDSLVGAPLLSFLAQLRGGFPNRPDHFPASLMLVGMRDLRDYLTVIKGTLVSPNSPFNIKAASLTLRNFTEAEIGELYQQHTDDTGQVFTPEATARAFSWTRGQPYLVNALAGICVDELVTDRALPVTAEHFDAAKEQLILRRVTHLDNLGQRLREPRVSRVVAPVILGEGMVDAQSDDFQYAVDLGLLRQGEQGIEAANPLYREVLVRELTINVQANLHAPWWPWRSTDGRLDFPGLMAAFLEWWPEHGDLLVDDLGPAWREVAAHLVFLGFLQRVVNGGGRVYREFGSGRGRVDVRVEYGPGVDIVELKRVAPDGNPERVLAQGIQQLTRYLDQQRQAEGWLLVFDQRPGLDWKARLWHRELTVEGRVIHVRGA